MVKWSILVNSKFDYHEQDILASQIPRYVSLWIVVSSFVEIF